MSSPVRLGNYLAEMHAYAPEIAAILTPDEQEEAWDYVQRIGEREYFLWMFENIDDILKFLESTPSKRKASKAWKESPYRYGVIVGALLILRPATKLVDVLDQHDAMSGCSYRSFARHSALSFLAAWYQFEFRNPFDRGNL